jgi:hypothetical protein
VAAKPEIHLVRDWNAAWSALVRPWLAAPAVLRRDYVVVPTRGQAHALKLRCVREGVPLLGVEFLTAGLARQKWVALAQPPRPALGRELLLFNLRSLLEERLARLAPENPAWGLWKSLQSDVERALDDFDALLQAGRSAADFPLPALRELFGALEQRITGLGYDFVATQDQAAAVAEGRATLGGRLLLCGFSTEHARNFASLVALTRHAEAVTVLLPQPEFGRRNDDERWIEAWEKILGVDAQALEDVDADGPGPQAARLWLEGVLPVELPHVLVGVTRADEMQLVAGEIVRRLAAGADNLAVIFPRTGAAHLRLARLLAERGVPFNDLLEATAPPPADVQLRRALLAFYERGGRFEELLELWPLLRADGHTDLAPGEARDVCERAFDQVQSHAVAAALPVLAARNRPQWKEVARVAGLLLPAWPERLSLGEALERFGAIGGRFRLPELEGWTALRAYARQDRRELSRPLVVTTLASFLPEKSAATEVPGRGLFAPVTLTTWRRAAGLGWSDVIFVQSNAGIWPERAEASCWLTDEQREAVNRRHPGEIGLATADSRAAAEREGLAAIARATAGTITFSAALFDEEDPELKLAPNAWLERVVLGRAGGAGTPEEQFAGLARAVASVAPEDPGGARWQEIWARRRDPAAPFDEYFLGGEPAAIRPAALAARLIEAGLRDPAVLWFEGVLQLRRTEWSPLVRKRRLTLGSLAHQVLARVLRGTPTGGAFARRPEPDEAETALRAELATLRARWPQDRYWDSFHAELGEMTRVLLNQVYRLPAGSFVAVETELPKGTEIPLADTGETIGVVGRMDLVLSDRPDWGGAHIDVVDFKTGADARLSAAAMAKGASLQLGVYLAAVQGLGTAAGRVWMLKPDETKPTHITAEELPLALAGLAQLSRHLATGKYGARTVDRTDFASGYAWPLACAPIPQAILEQKFAATFGAPVTPGAGEAADE